MARSTSRNGMKDHFSREFRAVEAHDRIGAQIRGHETSPVPDEADAMDMGTVLPSGIRSASMTHEPAAGINVGCAMDNRQERYGAAHIFGYGEMLARGRKRKMARVIEPRRPLPSRRQCAVARYGKQRKPWGIGRVKLLNGQDMPVAMDHPTSGTPVRCRAKARQLSGRRIELGDENPGIGEAGYVEANVRPIGQVSPVRRLSRQATYSGSASLASG